jgi:hypothetical protein
MQGRAHSRRPCWLFVQETVLAVKQEWVGELSPVAAGVAGGLVPAAAAGLNCMKPRLATVRM